MRKAFTLIEMLVVVTVLPFIMVTISGVYVTFIRDIPQTMRVLQENTTVLDVLEQIRRDMDDAVGLPGQFDGQRADERTLLLEQPGQVIRYHLEDGRIVRTPFVVTPSGASSDALTSTLQTRPPSDERLWRMRDAVITWRLWVNDDEAYAVKIHSHVKQRIVGFLREKLANSHVFFLRGLEGLVLSSRDAPVVTQMQGQDALATSEQGRDALATAGALHGLRIGTKEGGIR